LRYMNETLVVVGREKRQRHDERRTTTDDYIPHWLHHDERFVFAVVRAGFVRHILQGQDCAGYMHVALKSEEFLKGCPWHFRKRRSPTPYRTVQHCSLRLLPGWFDTRDHDCAGFICGDTMGSEFLASSPVSPWKTGTRYGLDHTAQHCSLRFVLAGFGSDFDAPFID
jgi:hypothetical protein